MDPDKSTTERMRRAVGAAASGKGSAEELEGAARALVAELRARNEPPEQVLLTMKQFLAEAGLRPSYASPSSSGDGDGHKAPNTIYRDVIALTIKSYYESR